MLVFLALGWAGRGIGICAEPAVTAADLPRVAATAPDKTIATFKIKPGFHLEQVAAEPLVMSPVAVAFDEKGRLFVVEMRDYSERREEHLGRVRMLEDRDGDGRYETSTVYVDQLPWPTGVICYNGGIFVAANPDIFFCKDLNGDGVADEKRVVFTGFGAGVEKLNVQQLLNSFNWSLDHRIHGAAGGNGGKVTSTAHPEMKPLDLRGKDFSFDPRTLEIRAESGGGQYGMSFDSRGRKFVCSNSSHIREILYEEHYAARSPFYAMPAAAIDIAVDGPAAEVFRISPDEPWRVIRTRWRVAGTVPGPIEGGGRPSGYFTGATGITIFRGGEWPQEFWGDAFVADCGSNLVHRKKLRPNGPALLAERPADEARVEFLASSDNWFRPVQLANGPDGNLYVVDMYREVIEHPWSLPPSLKEHLDLNSGNDRGRIYRIVPDSFRPGAPVRLGQAGIDELVKTLEHPNGWMRDTADRLIFERQDAAAVPGLRKVVAESRFAPGRVHALYALRGLGALTFPEIETSLRDRDPAVRQHAIRLCEPRFDLRLPGEKVLDHFIRLAIDPDPDVRYQLALSLGDFSGEKKEEALLALAQKMDAGDAWTPAALLGSVGEKPFDLFTNALAKLVQRQSLQIDQRFLGGLAGAIGERGNRNQVEAALAGLAGIHEGETAIGMVNALGRGLARAGGSLAALAPNQGLRLLADRAGGIIGSSGKNRERGRADAVEFLGMIRAQAAEASIISLINAGESELVQKSAVAALARYDDDAAAEGLLGQWPAATPVIRASIVETLLRKTALTRLLLRRIEERKIPIGALSIAQKGSLRKHSDPEVARLAESILGSAPTAGRAAVLKNFEPALQLTGRPERGRVIFVERCASCHRYAGAGQALGPDLESVRSSGRAVVLANILDPNREVAPRYAAYEVETTAGEKITGMIVAESGVAVTVAGPNGVSQEIPRTRIRALRTNEQSIMPEGLEEGLKGQDMADLLEYILNNP